MLFSWLRLRCRSVFVTAFVAGRQATSCSYIVHEGKLRYTSAGKPFRPRVKVIDVARWTLVMLEKRKQTQYDKMTPPVS